MSTIVLLVFASFVVGTVVGGFLVYMFLAARFEHAKQEFADELHRVIEREERAYRREAQRSAAA